MQPLRACDLSPNIKKNNYHFLCSHIPSLFIGSFFVTFMYYCPGFIFTIVFASLNSILFIVACFLTLCKWNHAAFLFGDLLLQLLIFLIHVIGCSYGAFHFHCCIVFHCVNSTFICSPHDICFVPSSIQPIKSILLLV